MAALGDLRTRKIRRKEKEVGSIVNPAAVDGQALAGDVLTVV